MSDDTLKIGGFGLLVQNLQDKNINTSEEELNLLFCDALEENNSESLTTDFFTQTIVEKYRLEDSEDILDVLNNIAENDENIDDLSIDDFAKQSKYDDYAKQIYDVTAGRLGTDEKAFNEILNNKNLNGENWANIIQTYNAMFNRDMIDDIDGDFSGIAESAKRNEIMTVITRELYKAIENGNETALNLVCQELHNSTQPTTNFGGVEASDTNKADEFITNMLLHSTSNDKVNALILSKYNKITESNLVDDIKNCTISQANKDLIINKLNLASQYNLNQNNENKSTLPKLNLENYSVDNQNKARIINILTESLNCSFADITAQNNQDGSISGNFNSIKVLTGLGVSSSDVAISLEEQETMIQELTEALNGTSTKFDSFEEAYEAWTGLAYDEEKIIQYQEDSNNYALACNISLSAQNFQNSISKADSLQDAYNLYIEYYGDEEKGKEEFLTYIKDGMIPNDPNNYNDTNDKVSAFGGYVTDVHFDDNGQLVVTKIINYGYKKENEEDEYETISYNLSDTANMVRTLPRTFDSEKYTNEANQLIESFIGTSLEELSKKYASSKQSALGNGDKLEELVNKYCQSQDGFMDKLAGATQIAGMGTIVVGGVTAFFCQPVGAGIMTVGKYMALGGMFGNQTLNAIDGLSSANGISAEETKALLKETFAEVGYLLVGSGINSVAAGAQTATLESLQTMGLSDKAATVCSWIAEGGTDIALSILSDLAIIGDLNLNGNTIQVLIGILTGVANAKVSSYKSKIQSEELSKLASGKTTLEEAEAKLKNEGFTDNEIAHFKETGTNFDANNSKTAIPEEGDTGTNNNKPIDYTEAIDEKIAEGLLSADEVRAVNSLRQNGITDEALTKIFSLSESDSNISNNLITISKLSDGHVIIDRLYRLVLNNKNPKIQQNFAKSLDYASKIVNLKITDSKTSEPEMANLSGFQISSIAKYLAQPGTKNYDIEQITKICKVESHFLGEIRNMDLSNIKTNCQEEIAQKLAENGFTKKTGKNNITQQILNDLHYEIARLAVIKYKTSENKNALEAMEKWVSYDKACEHYEGKLLQDPTRFTEIAESVKKHKLEFNDEITFEYGTIEEYTASIEQCINRVLSLNKEGLIGTRQSGKKEFKYYFLPDDENCTQGVIIICENGKISTIEPKQTYADFEKKFKELL